MLHDADAYGKAVDAYAKDKTLPRPKQDVVLASLVPAVRGQMPVIFPADRAADIRDAVTFAEEMKLKPIIVGGREAPEVAAFLKQHNVPVLITSVMDLPAREDDPYDVNYSTPGEARRGRRDVRDHVGRQQRRSRSLPYVAGMAAAFGLSKDDALKAVTLWPAQIFGVGDKLGSIEVGKMANLVVTTGDMLEAKTDTKYLFIDGRPGSAGHEQRRHQVHRHRVRVRLRHAVRDLVLADVVHQHRPSDARHRPGGEQPPVNRADLHRAEQIAEVRGNRREAAAVHAEDHEVERDEQRHAADAPGGRDQRVERGAEHEEDHVRRAAADVVGERRPEEAAAHVGEAEQSHEPRGGGAEITPGNISWIIGDAWPSTPMPGGHVQAEHDPEQPELRRLDRLVHVHVRRGRRAPRCAMAVASAIHPAGAHPGAGRRTVNTPNIMKTK